MLHLKGIFLLRASVPQAVTLHFMELKEASESHKVTTLTQQITLNIENFIQRFEKQYF